MSFNMRVWCILAFTAAFFLVPDIAVCQIDLRDPYARQSILAEVTLSFDDFHEIYDDGIERIDREFEQIYSLTFKGNLWDPRLIIYDANVEFDTTDYTTESASQDNNLWHYGFSTTVMRKLRFPLSLFVYRDTIETTGATQQETILDTYGFNWLMKFRLLPVTRLSFTNLHTTDTLPANTLENETKNFNAELTKDIGPTRNRLNYTFNETKNLKEPGNDQTSKNITYQNNTDISRHTKFSFSAVRSTFDNSSTDTTGGSGEVTGFSSSVTSSPSDNFNQSHFYTFYENKSDDGIQRGESYSGNMNYKFTKRLSSGFSLTFGDTKNRTTTTNIDTNNIATRGFLNYLVTDHLSVRETVFYSKSETSTPTSATGESGRKNISVTTTVFYRRGFKWFNLRSSVGAGYRQEDVEPFGGGKGISGNASLALTKIDLNYVDLNTSVNWYKFKSISGDAFEEKRSFSAFTTNNFWKKYVNLQLKYSNNLTKAWIHVLETRSENLNLKAQSAYFRGTSITAIADYYKLYTPVTDRSVTTSGTLRVTHSRPLLGGNARAGVRFRISRSDFRGNEETTISSYYFANYGRLLRQNLLWRVTMQYTDTKYENSFYRSASASNAFVYTLRAWRLSALFDYSKTDDSFRSWTGRRVMLKATRSFLRIF